MKRLVVTISLLLFLVFPNIGYCGKLPSDILTAKCIYGIYCSEEDYEKVLQITSDQLGAMGFNVVYYYHINENPTIRQRNFEVFKKELQGVEYKYIINVSIAYNAAINDYSCSFFISKLGKKSLLVYDHQFFISRSNFKALFIELDNNLKKLQK